MRRVIVESPWSGGGDTARNIRYLRACLLDCYERGEAPIASHAIGTQCLDESPENRRRGIEAGLEWWSVTDMLVFYVDLGWSAGMEAAMEHIAVGELAGKHFPCETRRLGARREELEARAEVAARAQGWKP